jgi:ribosomal protein S10
MSSAVTTPPIIIVAGAFTFSSAATMTIVDSTPVSGESYDNHEKAIYKRLIEIIIETHQYL